MIFMTHGKNTQMVGARVQDPVADRVRALAQSEGLTVSEWIGRAIKEYLERENHAERTDLRQS